MTENEKLYDRAIQAVHDLYNDTSVPVEKTKENMDAVLEDITALIDGLDL